MQEDRHSKVATRKLRFEEVVDMTPMVDVTFLLLIFFMVTAAFSLQRSIEMPRRNEEGLRKLDIREPLEELSEVEVEIDESGSYLVLACQWQRETTGKRNLVTALKDAIEKNASDARLVVKVHESARLQALVDALDAGTIAGYASLEISQFEGFD